MPKGLVRICKRDTDTATSHHNGISHSLQSIKECPVAGRGINYSGGRLTPICYHQAAGLRPKIA